jgi:hypothetical protein
VVEHQPSKHEALRSKHSTIKKKKKKKELAHVITNMLNILNVNKYVNIYVHKYLFYIILKQLRLYYAYQKKYCESVSSGSL